MPNDRAISSLLKNLDFNKYPKLAQFLTGQTLSENKQTNILSNQQALDLLEEAIGEVEDRDSLDKNLIPATSRLKEMNQQVVVPAVESKTDSIDSENKQAELDLTIEQDSQTKETQTNEKKPVTELVRSNESAEMAEIGQELSEIKEIDQDKEEQVLRQKQQADIDQLANQVQNPSAPVKPVVVLPITEQQQKIAKKKGIHFSLRWLAEWADKIKKIFAGAILYKEEVENSTDV